VSVEGDTTAYAGNGGSVTYGTTAGRTGGTATATTTITASQAVVANATANGGTGGTSAGGAGGVGGNATATSVATGVTVASDASANSGSGPGGAGIAKATATGSGTAGTANAQTTTIEPAPSHVTSLSADASAGVSGTTTVSAETLLIGTTPTFITSSQAVAFGTGLPSSASINPILTANASISAAFGSHPSVLAIEEIGGSHSTGASGSQTSTSTVDFNAILNAQDSAQDLKIGLFSGQAFGNGVTGMTLDIDVDGVDLIKQSFANASAATAYFTNHAVDLGPLSGGNYSSGTLDVQVQLQVSTNTAHSGFFGGLIVSG
jgi:hypothetical protein